MADQRRVVDDPPGAVHHAGQLGQHFQAGTPFHTRLVLGLGTAWILDPDATRIMAGMGIGGEYSAINSAIDEMMPARYRGRTDIWINGTYWLGAILGTFASFLLLNSMRPNEGWRVAFLAGPAL